jgi:hypothetical protein
MIEITKSGPVFSGSTDELDELRGRFDREHCVLLRQFLHPQLLVMIQKQLERAVFKERLITTLHPPSADLIMENNAIRQAFLLLLNNQKLFEIIEYITGCPKIGCFKGSVYRMTSTYGHDTWHHDLEGHRLVALSINLSTSVYSGGVLRIRDVEKSSIVSEISNTGFGDAVVIRLAPQIEHKVSRVTGPIDKTAFAGKFKSEPNFHTLVRDNLLRLQDRPQEVKSHSLGINS